jgi:hypothetical protein
MLYLLAEATLQSENNALEPSPRPPAQKINQASALTC